MLIDDQLPNLIAMEQTLCDLDISIDKASSAEEALSKLLKSKYHFVLSDVDLPDMNGVELSSMIRKDPALSHLPIILFTGKIFSVNQSAKAFKAGVFDYLVKPIDSNLLRAKVKLLMENEVYKQKLFEISSILGDLEKRALAPLSKFVGSNEEIKAAIDYLREIQGVTTGKIK